MKLNDLSGKTFGKLFVVERDPDKKSRPYWLCKCECGTIVSVKGSSLSGGLTNSCGCLRHTTIHGDSVGGKRTRLQRIYHTMISRCTNINSTGYNNYGGRGISVCHQWLNSYMDFKQWALANGYVDNLSIDRIDTNGDYEPNNCRWSTKAEQNNNKRNHILITLNGRTQNAKQWADELGVCYSTVVSRYHKGLPAKDILAK